MFDQDMIKLVELIGGKDNIVRVTHCISRLRFILKDNTLTKKEEIENLDTVAGVFESGGMFQVIIGVEVPKAYKALISVVGEEKMSNLKDAKNEGYIKQGIVARFMLIFPGVFMPIIPAIAACGLLMGLKNLLNAKGIFAAGMTFVEVFPATGDIVSLMSVFAETAFSFLPVLIGWSGATYFGASPILGLVLGLLLVHPSLTNGWDAVPGNYEHWNVLGIKIAKVGYQGSVLPMLVSVWVLSKVEAFFDKYIHATLKFVFVPMCTIFTTGLLAFTIIGPIGREIGLALGHFMLMIHDKAPLVGGFLIGITFQPIVVTGMHHTYTAINMQLYGQGVGSYLFPIEALADWSNTVACFASMFLINSKKMKDLAFSSAVTNAFGISEPAMFGITLRYKWPFLAGIISCGFWSAFISVNNVTSPGGGLSSLLSFISMDPVKIPIYLIAQIGVVITTTALVFIFKRFTKFD